jgi:hypothetical protein
LTSAAAVTDGAAAAALTSSAGRDVLVIGSYPPVPTAGATVTLEMVRRLWAEGAHPHVAAPRSSAANFTVAVTGLMAGRRLTHLRQLTGAVDVVLCAERDLPVSTHGPTLLLPFLQRISVDRLVLALAAFEHVTVVACGDPGVPAPLWARLVFAADVVVDRSDASGAPGVTTLGPSEHPGSNLRRWTGRLAPWVLGRHEPAARRARARAAHLTRRVRAGR